jgi:hypothetical protein
MRRRRANETKATPVPRSAQAVMIQARTGAGADGVSGSSTPYSPEFVLDPG